MQDLKIEYIPVGKVKPYEKNARKHKDFDVDAIVRSIEEFGFDDPIGIWSDQNIIVEGHGRLMAAKKLGMTEVPCIRLDHLTDEQRRAYALAHNKTAENSEWDLELLPLELDDIVGIDMSQFGFDVERDDPVAVEDNFEPEILDDPKAKLGDIYQLGRHRLMCGDSTHTDDVERLMGGCVADMLLTDPPYGVDYEGAAGKIKNDSMKDEDFFLFLRDAFSAANAVLKRGGAFHIWYADYRVQQFCSACDAAKMVIRQHLIWVKSQSTLGRQDFQHQYESVLAGYALDDEDFEKGFDTCLYGWKSGEAHKWFKKRREKDVMFFQKPLASKDHPTMKPIPLFDYEMKCNTKPGENVLDLFGGSGTTLIAAEQNGRNAFIMEFDPKFVDVIIERWERFTGERAVLLNGEDSV